MTAHVGLAILREPDDIDTCDMQTGHGPCMLPGDHKGGCIGLARIPLRDVTPDNPVWLPGTWTAA